MSIFSKVKVKRPKRSTFNLSHDTKFTMPFGWLVPVYWTYLEPNVTFKASSEIMARFAPMFAPIMHRVNFYSYWFEVPLRLLMEKSDYENFMTGGRTGNEEVSFPKFRVPQDSNVRGYSLLDYMGVPPVPLATAEGDTCTFDAPPFRAYTTIWNEYFRDENTTDPIELDLFTGIKDVTDEDEDTTNLDTLSIKSRCWEKDYFTSALPFAQRGTAAKVPLTVLSELAMDGKDVTRVTNVDNDALTNNTSFKRGNLITGISPGSGNKQYEVLDTLSQDGVQFDITNHTKVTSRVSGTINDLRQMFALQRWYERNAVGGARYIEQINAHFGVWGDDYRLQRPKYLGGARTPLAISEVLQTSASQEDSAQGTMSGRGFTMDKNGFVGTFTKEHSIIMCLVCCVPKPAYFQGMPRKLDIRDRYDFVWPELAHLGEQEVRKKEIFCQSDGTSANDQTFGYQSRYAQYKYEPNEIHTDFRHTMKFWHLGRVFSTVPALNRQFLTVDATNDTLNRIFAVEENSIYDDMQYPIWVQMAFNIRAKRPLPYFGTPR